MASVMAPLKRIEKSGPGGFALRGPPRARAGTSEWQREGHFRGFGDVLHRSIKAYVRRKNGCFVTKRVPCVTAKWAGYVVCLLKGKRGFVRRLLLQPEWP